MVSPFLAQYAQVFKEPALFADVANQFPVSIRLPPLPNRIFPVDHYES